MKNAKGKGAVKVSKEALKPVDDRKVGKRKAPSKPDKGSAPKAKKEKKAKKDPNKPKRPPSAFFVFLEEFRQTFKAENPNVKAVSAVGKAGGEKWKSLSSAEKAPYEAKAAKRKAEYEKLMKAYDKKQASSADDDESDKSKSEVNDEDDEASAEDHQEEEEEEDDEDEEDEDDD
ncbi:high mobility group B protein 1 [Vigna umbellata]|uniref:High mobility group B protein n=2 Tax=Phaseolus angularis TaxID=3914 RepID=A0A0L9VTF1_PHAAN|nr:high mobility group B protein 1 [Vigna angularis]XP_017442645.1 high mobility group B protein 1 [Vigna angularis]XP_017442646.1 high mobility group B protein 1 [Vigna angularis]XP_017442648.1 high mobility group B protein 1 [Vigna angularis]XP_047170175.1 high mobility group B protein 1 [Vigna umbellata]XP_047170176.1 high mobility group B protein 1 [Vigna umbellata]XP_047170177.1 high mobility group B protein 1 [Vigna umbellata]XP_047170178.1 high mobility group B protein 1 [Vigna umbell